MALCDETCPCFPADLKMWYLVMWQKHFSSSYMFPSPLHLYGCRVRSRVPHLPLGSIWESRRRLITGTQPQCHIAEFCPARSIQMKAYKDKFRPVLFQIWFLWSISVGYLLSALLFLLWRGEPCINEFIRLTIYSKLASMFSAVGYLLLAFLGNEEKFLDYQQAKGETDVCSHTFRCMKKKCKGLLMCAW